MIDSCALQEGECINARQTITVSANNAQKCCRYGTDDQGDEIKHHHEINLIQQQAAPTLGQGLGKRRAFSDAYHQILDRRQVQDRSKDGINRHRQEGWAGRFIQVGVSFKQGIITGVLVVIVDRKSALVHDRQGQIQAGCLAPIRPAGQEIGVAQQQAEENQPSDALLMRR